MDDPWLAVLSVVPAALTTMALTPAVRRLARATGLVAVTKDDRWHRGDIPLLGGMAIFGGVLAGGLALWLSRGIWSSGFATAVGLMFGTGLVDDYLGLRPSTKLAAQLVTGCLVWIVGPQLRWTGMPVADMFLFLAWFTAVTNAFNLLDNMDGLSAGVAAIGALAVALSAGPSQGHAFGMSLAIAGAAAAFLLFNFKPASIFMGDSGSLMLGASLAVLSTTAGHGGSRGILSAIAVPVLLLLIPIFDTAFVTLSRKLSSRAASQGGRDHTSHRLVAMGFSERQAVLLCYSLAAVGGAGGIALGRYNFPETNALVVLLVVGLLLLAVQLAGVRVYDGADFSVLKQRAFTPLLIEVTYRRRIFEVLLDVLLISVAYYFSYIIRFDVEFPIYRGLVVQSLPTVLACHLASFFVAGVYRGVWRYFSLSDVTIYLKGLALGMLTSILSLVYLYRFEGYSRGVFIINFLVLGVLAVGSRTSFRFIAEMASRQRSTGERVLIYGAGDGGALLVRELRNNARLSAVPLAFIDDDPGKRDRRILGLAVVGGIEQLRAVLAEYRIETVMLSTEKLPGPRLRLLEQECAAAGVRLVRLSFRLEEVSAS